MVLTLCEVLDIPLDETNQLLTRAGFAPAYRSRGLEGAQAAPVRAALSFLLRQHHPYPAVVVDPGYNVVWANDAYVQLACWVRDAPFAPANPNLLHDEPPVAGSNALVPLFEDAALRARVTNFPQFASYVLGHLRRAARDEPSAAATLRRLASEASISPVHDGALPVVIPLELSINGAILRLFTTMTMFGSSTDSVLAALRVETFFPANDETDRLLRKQLTSGDAPRR